MPKIGSKDEADALRPFRFHGLDLSLNGSNQAVGQCIFCDKEEKFYVNADTGMWDCKSCGEKGNATTFLRQLWELSDKDTRNYDSLQTDRLLSLPETLSVWGVAQSLTTGEWVVPAYGVDGKLNQLYRYVKVKDKFRLLPTPTLNHHLHGVNLYNRARDTVYITEGPWDGMVLWEMLKSARSDNGKLSITSNESSSLLAHSNVLAVPGANVWLPSWGQLCAGKIVVLLFDNDHPGSNGQATGLDGMRRVAQALASAEEPPKEIKYLEWGGKGYNDKLPSGYDVRDLLTNQGRCEIPTSRLPHLADLFAKIRPVPEDWLKGIARTSIACDSWAELVTSWRKAMKWIPGLDKALSVMLSSVTSTMATGDQLWIRVVSPPSTGKSVLCEALSVNKKYVVAKSTIRGFHSGYKTDKEGAEDHSLIEQLKGKTLVVKDGDTLLQSPNLGQILAEARDIYDRVGRSDYRNGVRRNHENVPMTWILCGTASLRSLDNSELGERFIDCVIMDRIDTEVEDAILEKVVNKARSAVTQETNGKAVSMDSPEMVKAKQLTSGYIDHLRRNAQRLLSAVEANMSYGANRECINYGKLIAYMRARPSVKQDESAGREMAARLVSQMVRLALCLAVVMNRRSIDDTVLMRVRSVALDTARGTTLDMCRHMYNAGKDGVDMKALAMWINLTEDKCRTLLRFLRQIEVSESFTSGASRGFKGKARWRLTEKVRQLYKNVVEEVYVEP